jgi:hypothetical protein
MIRNAWRHGDYTWFHDEVTNNNWMLLVVCVLVR